MPADDAAVDDFDDLPSTLQRSPRSARDTYAEAKAGAEEQYGKGEIAARTAYATLKRTHEKVGDHWEPKAESGPSDSRAESGGSNPSGETAGGVDAQASKDHLYARAQELDVDGRSQMTKDELVDAIERANEQETRKARGDT